jgi:hypothetical protein
MPLTLIRENSRNAGKHHMMIVVSLSSSKISCNIFYLSGRIRILVIFNDLKWISCNIFYLSGRIRILVIFNDLKWIYVVCYIK